MVISGRSRGNGAQLADYLLGNRENDIATVLDIRGTSRPHDLKKSLLEMSLSSEMSKGSHGLYHAQINPAIGEDRPMSREDWQTAADILEQHLGLDGQKRAIVLHEKKGRIHAHIVWERYDHTSQILRTDGQNYKKHDQAREAIERTLGHVLTPQTDRQQRKEKQSDFKAELSDLWHSTKDGKSFVLAAEKAGYQIAQADDRRPWRVITPDGQSLDLVRQLSDTRTKDVRDRLQPIRSELKTEAAALDDIRKKTYEQARTLEKEPKNAPQKSDKGREISESQSIAEFMRNRVRQEKQAEKERSKGYSYSFKFEQSPAPISQPEQKPKSDKSRDLSDSQDLAAAMREHVRKAKEPAAPEQSDKKREMSESQDLAAAMLKKQKAERDAANDNSPLAKYRSNKNSPLEKYRSNDNSPLAKYRQKAEDSPLAKYRSQKDTTTRGKGRTRDHNDID